MSRVVVLLAAILGGSVAIASGIEVARYMLAKQKDIGRHARRDDDDDDPPGPTKLLAGPVPPRSDHTFDQPADKRASDENRSSSCVAAPMPTEFARLALQRARLALR